MADPPPDAVVWVDLVDPDRAAVEAALGRTLHARAIQQLLAPHRHRDDPRPALEGHGDDVFGVFLVPQSSTTPPSSTASWTSSRRRTSS